MPDRELTYRQAENEAIRGEMHRDPRVIYVGEGVAGGAVLPGRKQGYAGASGIFGLTAGLFDTFGPARVREAPISEAAWVGAAIGAALTGLRPVADLSFIDFVGVCADQLINNAAKLRYLNGGRASVPLTLITSFGAAGGAAAHHSQSFYSILAHIPGLKCVAPSDAYTVKGLVAAAIRDDDPVLVFDHKHLQNRTAQVPEDAYTLPIGKGRIVRPGKDVTIAGISWMVTQCREAAEQLERDGIEAEVVDLLSLSPLDEDLLLESVGRTGRLVVVDEDTPHGGIAAEVAARVADRGYDLLRAPIKRVTSPHAPVPYARLLEREYTPNADDTARAARAVLEQPRASAGGRARAGRSQKAGA